MFFLWFYSFRILVIFRVVFLYLWFELFVDVIIVSLGGFLFDRFVILVFFKCFCFKLIFIFDNITERMILEMCVYVFFIGR